MNCVAAGSPSSPASTFGSGCLLCRRGGHPTPPDPAVGNFVIAGEDVLTGRLIQSRLPALAAPLGRPSSPTTASGSGERRLENASSTAAAIGSVRAEIGEQFMERWWGGMVEEERQCRGRLQVVTGVCDFFFLRVGGEEVEGKRELGWFMVI